MRHSDLFARWGGEEFIILLPSTALDAAIQIAEDLRIMIALERFPEVNQMSCSFGIAQWDGHESKDRLLQRLDDYLYQAKESGRNCIVSDKTS